SSNDDSEDGSEDNAAQSEDALLSRGHCTEGLCRNWDDLRAWVTIDSDGKTRAHCYALKPNRYLYVSSNLLEQMGILGWSAAAGYVRYGLSHLNVPIAHPTAGNRKYKAVCYAEYMSFGDWSGFVSYESNVKQSP